MQSKLGIVWNGIFKENPALRLVLGTCPTLAVTTLAMNGLGMGLAATFVLVCSGAAVSALRHIIPSEVRLPAYITIIAAFVTALMMLVKAYLPSLNTALGVYLPLIVVNCIILGRAEMFASKHGVLDSALDGLGMGLGFTLTLVLMGSIRQHGIHEPLIQTDFSSIIGDAEHIVCGRVHNTGMDVSRTLGQALHHLLLELRFLLILGIAINPLFLPKI